MCEGCTDDLQKVADLIFSEVNDAAGDIVAGVFFDRDGCARVRVSPGVPHDLIRRRLADLARDYWIGAHEIQDAARLN